jgi:hypothetical protein
VPTKRSRSAYAGGRSGWHSRRLLARVREGMVAGRGTEVMPAGCRCCFLTAVTADWTALVGNEEEPTR